MKTNFSAKTAKAFRTSANNESKGMNYAIKAIKAVWNSTDKTDELSASIKAAKADGLKLDDFSSKFIIDNLTGTKWVSGSSIMTNKKGQMVNKETWTAGAVIDYVRRANKARLEKANK